MLNVTYRRGEFDTVNGFTEKEVLWIVTEDDYIKWRYDEEYLYCGDIFSCDYPLATIDDIISALKEEEYYDECDFGDYENIERIIKQEHVYTFDEFFAQPGYDKFDKDYYLSDGQTVVAFGYRKQKINNA